MREILKNAAQKIKQIISQGFMNSPEVAHDSIFAQEEPGSAPLWIRMLAPATRKLPVGKYSIIQRVRQTRQKPFVARMPQELGGYDFRCSLQDNVAAQVLFAGCYEAQESAFARAVLQPGMTFVDVGANWGFFSFFAAHLVGTKGRIIALEPDPRIFLRLKENVRRNSLERQIQLFELAAADRESSLVLALQHEEEFHLGTSRLVQNQGMGPRTCSVSTQPLDKVLDEAGLDCVDLVKIDVEGAEDMVLAGMEAGLNRHRYRNLILELHPVQLGERNRTIHEVINLLTSKGYKGLGLDHSPAACRKAGYSPGLHVREFIQPLKAALVDPWPHTVWMAPGQAALV
ncbi:MAG TPA: FkbM family methyltransferase [Candidatus Angelobacter sp.]|nr:FkbM family methyltransferase [Candidatus Angelobacter sp.]